MWKNIEAAPVDSIFGLTEAFRRATNPQKVNLGVGVYKDNQGKTPVLQCVKAAEQLLLAREESNLCRGLSLAMAVKLSTLPGRRPFMLPGVLGPCVLVLS